MGDFQRITLLGLFVLAAVAIAPAAAQDFYYVSTDLLTSEPLPGQDLHFQCRIEGEPVEIRLYYRLDGGDWTMVQMGTTKSNKFVEYYDYIYYDPPTTDGMVVDYYFEATHASLPSIRYPADAPATYESQAITYNAEAFGVFFGDTGVQHVHDTTEVAEAVTMRICMRYPDSTPVKGEGEIYAWDLQLRFAGAVSIGAWSYSYGGSNDPTKALTDKNGDTIVPFHVTLMFPMSNHMSNVLDLAETTLIVAGVDDPVSVFIEPRAGSGHDAPSYQTQSGAPWREAGTSSGGDPTDPSPDWSVACGYINLTGVVEDADATWGQVKALYR